MTPFSTVLHPGFDELSAFADRHDVGAARTRTGRHVARCEQCRAIVAEIRAMGAAVRESRVSGAPAGLWVRIERRLDEGDVTAPPVTLERAVEPTVVNDRETKSAPRPVSRAMQVTKRSALVLVALVAVSAAVVALDAHRPLAAATPLRLTTDREFAQPGSRITLHYRPIPALAALPSLTVWMFEPDQHPRWNDPLLVRVGTLQRVSALDYTGTLAMPNRAPVVMFLVGDSSGLIIDRTEMRGARMPVAVLAGDSSGRPRLDALVTALGNIRGRTDQPVLTRWATLMREHYPNDPETWILSDLYRRRTVVDDIVKVFESRERRYYGWHDRLEHRKNVSAVTESMMANIGWELMDTARADFWIARLLRDHPTSSDGAAAWLLRRRDVPNDSAAIVLRAFEPIYARADSAIEALYAAASLAQRSGDSSLIQLWNLRADPGGYSWLLGSELAAIAKDPAARNDASRRLQAALAETDSEMHSGPTLSGRSQFFAWHTRQRLRTRIAALQLLAGDASGAKAALDSIAYESEMKPICESPETLRWRAEASRRLGRMDEARADLAYVATTENWRLQLVSDSAAALLGSAYTRSSWDSALAAARQVREACYARGREARRRAGG
jgi:hypothetical protein